jgi:hypothetical protein
VRTAKEAVGRWRHRGRRNGRKNASVDGPLDMLCQAFVASFAVQPDAKRRLNIRSLKLIAPLSNPSDKKITHRGNKKRLDCNVGVLFATAKK